MDAREQFRSAQSALADACGVEITAHELAVDLDVPISTAHAVTAGPEEGEPVLFLPGATQPGAAYLPLIADLADEYRCVAVDRPGDGLTDPVDFSTVSYRDVTRQLYPAVLDALDIDTTHLVAHSQGGFQAFQLAFERPERLRKLCLLGAPGGLTSEGPLVFRLLAVPYLNRLLLRLSAHDDPEAVRDDWTGTLVEDASAVPEALLRLQIADESLPGRIETQATIAESLWSPLSGTRSAFVFPDRVREIERPTLFVWGTEDFYLPPSIGRPVADDMPNAQFELLDGAGHTVWLEADYDVGDRLRSFLGE